MKGRTYSFLRGLGVGSWLAGFAPLGEAIDRVWDAGYDNCAISFTGLYSELAEKYHMQRYAVEPSIRRLLDIAWRNPDGRNLMERVMNAPLDRSPSVKRFTYAAADFLRSAEENEMLGYEERSG